MDALIECARARIARGYVIYNDLDVSYWSGTLRSTREFPGWEGTPRRGRSLPPSRNTWEDAVLARIFSGGSE